MKSLYDSTVENATDKCESCKIVCLLQKYMDTLKVALSILTEKNPRDADETLCGADKCWIAHKKAAAGQAAAEDLIHFFFPKEP